jgi:hypothetical protein
MALRIVANRPDPAVLTLPWALCLEEWGDEFLVPLPRGLSRHVVRIVRLRDRVYAVKETQEEMAVREYRLLRDLQRIGLPAVVPQAIVAGRVDADGEELPAALMTQHLRFSLPYRSLFAHGVTAADVPSLVDAMVVLLPMAKTGGVKALAVTTAKRSAAAPDIPTAAESGVPGLNVVSWYGMWGPKGIPTDVVKALNAATSDAMRELATAGRLAALGVEPTYATPEEFAKFQAAEVERSGEILKSANFKPQ